MTHQPMGVSGVDTDIVTGRPAYEQRLFELAKDDPFLRGLDMQATAYNLKLNFGPMVAAKMRRQSFGVVLNSMTDETKVALEGIPAEE